MGEGGLRVEDDRCFLVKFLKIPLQSVHYFLYIYRVRNDRNVTLNQIGVTYMSLTLNDIKHNKIKAWVEECIAMCEPDNVVVVDGSKEEYDALMQKCVNAGLATKLAKKENCYLFRSLPSDVALMISY